MSAEDTFGNKFLQHSPRIDASAAAKVSGYTGARKTCLAFLQTEASKHVSLHIFFKMFPNNSSQHSSFETNAFLAIIEGAMVSLITLFFCSRFDRSSGHRVRRDSRCKPRASNVHLGRVHVVCCIS